MLTWFTIISLAMVLLSISNFFHAPASGKCSLCAQLVSSDEICPHRLLGSDALNDLKDPSYLQEKDRLEHALKTWQPEKGVVPTQPIVWAKSIEEFRPLHAALVVGCFMSLLYFVMNRWVSARSDPNLFCAYMGIGFILAIIFVLTLWNSLNLQGRIMRTGAATPARIDQLMMWNSRHSSTRYLLLVSYFYADKLWRVRLPVKDLRVFALGEIVTVLVDPKSPDMALVYTRNRLSSAQERL